MLLKRNENYDGSKRKRRLKGTDVIVEIHLTNVEDYVIKAYRMFSLENQLTYKNLIRLTTCKKNTFKIFRNRAFLKQYDVTDKGYKTNVARMYEIKIIIRRTIKALNLTFPEHKIIAMGRRIYQRLVDFLTCNSTRICISFFMTTERKHTMLFLKQIERVFGSSNFNIKKYYNTVKAGIDNDDEAESILDVTAIHNMTCRILQFAGDMIHDDSSYYSDLVPNMHEDSVSDLQEDELGWKKEKRILIHI